MKARVISTLLSGAILLGLLEAALPATVQAAEAPAIPEVESVIPPVDYNQDIDEENIEWDLDMGDVDSVPTPPAPGADTADLPQAPAPAPAARQRLSRPQAPAGLALVDGVYTLAPQNTGNGLLRAQSAAPATELDLTGQRIVMPQGKTVLRIEGVDELTLSGLVIEFSPEATMPQEEGATPPEDENAAPQEDESAASTPAESTPVASESTPAPEAGSDTGAPADSAPAPESTGDAMADPAAAGFAEPAGDAFATQLTTLSAEPAAETAPPLSDPSSLLPPSSLPQEETPAESGSTPESDTSAGASAPESTPDAAPAESTAPSESAAPPESTPAAPPESSSAPAESESAPAAAPESMAAPEADSDTGAQEDTPPEATEATGQDGPALLIEGCKNLTLRDVAIVGATDTAVVVGEGNDRVQLDRVYIGDTAGDGVVFSEGVSAPVLTNSVVHSTGSAVVAGQNLYMHNNLLEGSAPLQLNGTGANVQYNNITAGAVQGQNTQNLLLANNRFEDSTPLVLNGDESPVIIGNTLPGGIDATGTANLVARDNTLGAPITLRGGDTALIEGNTLNGATTGVANNIGNTNVYGSNAGANEDILPNYGNRRTKFLNTPRTTTVYGKDIENYIADELKEHNTVIIPSGAYSVSTLNFKNLVGSTIYADNVLFEFDDITAIGMNFNSCSNVTVKGLTIDYEEIPFAQGTITSVAGSAVVWRADKGYLQELNDGAVFTSLYGHGFKAGSIRAFQDFGFSGASRNSEGVYTLYGGAAGLQAGDKLVLRAKAARVNLFSRCNSMRYEDVAVLGGSGFAFHDWQGEGGMQLLRCVVTPGAAPRLAGGVVGEARLVSTLDATHSTGQRQGPQVESCVFEQMTDDGANINSQYAAAIGYDAGSRTLIYNNGANLKIDFRPGDRLMAYTTDGRLLADCFVPAASYNQGANGYVQLPAVNFTYVPGNTLISNASANGAGYFYSNTIIRNNRSRGFAIKAPSGTIQNCTLRYNGMSGVMIRPETTDGWGESGLTVGTTIVGCHFEYGGYYANLEAYSPICIGTDAAASKDPEYQSQRNVFIQGNSFASRYTTYAVAASNAQNITLTANSFGTRRGNENSPAIRMEGVTGANISGNAYPGTVKPRMHLYGNSLKSVGGSDIQKDCWIYTTEKLELNMRAKTLAKKGNKIQLRAVFTPAAAKNHIKVTWKSSNPKVAKVNKNGKVTAVKNGKATITATTADGKKMTCKIHVGGVPVRSVKLNRTKLTLNAKKSFKLKATLTPEKPSNRKLTWESSDPTIAKVNKSGKVTALKKGTCKITVKSQDGSKKRVCTVRVR